MVSREQATGNHWSLSQGTPASDGLDRDEFHVLLDQFGGLEIAEIVITNRFGLREFDIGDFPGERRREPAATAEQIHGNDRRIG